MSHRRPPIAILCACAGPLGHCFSAAAAAPSLCLVVQDPDPIVGQRLSVHIELGEGDTAITGGEFAIEYDPSALGFLGVQVGAVCDASSPFSFLPEVSLDEVAGTIGMAVTVPLFDLGTKGPAVMACLEFVPLGGDATDVCLVDRAASPTFLLDAASAIVDPLNDEACPAVAPLLSCDTVEAPRPNECGLLDSDADGDIDLADFAVFQRCLTGPGGG